MITVVKKRRMMLFFLSRRFIFVNFASVNLNLRTFREH